MQGKNAFMRTEWSLDMLSLPVKVATITDSLSPQGNSTDAGHGIRQESGLRPPRPRHRGLPHSAEARPSVHVDPFLAGRRRGDEAAVGLRALPASWSSPAGGHAEGMC